MGYYTEYEFNWEHIGAYPGSLDELRALIEKEEIPDYEIPFVDVESQGTIKWYEHDEDMKALSMKYPNVLFTLSGEGEESGDIWKKYFMDGKVQYTKAKLSYDDFDAKKLK